MLIAELITGLTIIVIAVELTEHASAPSVLVAPLINCVSKVNAPGWKVELVEPAPAEAQAPQGSTLDGRVLETHWYARVPSAKAGVRLDNKGGVSPLQTLVTDDEIVPAVIEFSVTKTDVLLALQSSVPPISLRITTRL